MFISLEAKCFAEILLNKVNFSGNKNSQSWCSTSLPKNMQLPGKQNEFCQFSLSNCRTGLELQEGWEKYSLTIDCCCPKWRQQKGGSNCSSLACYCFLNGSSLKCCTFSLTWLWGRDIYNLETLEADMSNGHKCKWDWTGNQKVEINGLTELKVLSL